MLFRNCNTISNDYKSKQSPLQTPLKRAKKHLCVISALNKYRSINIEDLSFFSKRF
jgi:hypothetical protein